MVTAITTHTYDLNDNIIFNAKTKTFIAEVSDSGLQPDKQLYLRNPRTNISVLFTFSHADKDEGDIQGWHYKSEPNYLLNLLIIND